jgi:hypothetical protein
MVPVGTIPFKPEDDEHIVNSYANSLSIVYREHCIFGKNTRYAQFIFNENGAKFEYFAALDYEYINYRCELTVSQGESRCFDIKISENDDDARLFARVEVEDSTCTLDLTAQQCFEHFQDFWNCLFWKAGKQFDDIIQIMEFDLRNSQDASCQWQLQTN